MKKDEVEINEAYQEVIFHPDLKGEMQFLQDEKVEEGKPCFLFGKARALGAGHG